MGRPSLLVARAEKQNSEVTGVWIGGGCIAVTSGTIKVD